MRVFGVNLGTIKSKLNGLPGGHGNTVGECYYRDGGRKAVGSP